ncbi:MAG TPA: sigma-70 family RNA polymerase sigma factor [Kofleriaceae bacterium]|nr:sigma-70 family RNA polymerase sigma factor [Kofleriaceae bacterium]
MDDGSAAEGVAIESASPPAVEVSAGSPWEPPRSRANQAVEHEALACVHRGQTQRALALLLDAYGSAVTAIAVRVLRNPELAKDVRQQVFLEAFQGFARFEGRGSLLGWLCGITYHRCLDELRRRKRIAPSDAFQVVDELDREPDPAMDANRAANRRALEHCLAKLPPRVQAQVLMRYLEGMSYVEIGQIVQEPSGTVQVRISRILPRLRRCLRGEGVER